MTLSMVSSSFFRISTPSRLASNESSLFESFFASLLFSLKFKLDTIDFNLVFSSLRKRICSFCSFSLDFNNSKNKKKRKINLKKFHQNKSQIKYKYFVEFDERIAFAFERIDLLFAYEKTI